MSSLTSSSTFEEALAVYQANAGYREDGSVTEAQAFVTACRWLLSSWPKNVRTAAGTDISLSPEILERQIREAQQFVAQAGQPAGNTKFYSFRGFRD
jgi:hypothetical protein